MWRRDFGFQLRVLLLPLDLLQLRIASTSYSPHHPSIQQHHERASASQRRLAVADSSAPALLFSERPSDPSRGMSALPRTRTRTRSGGRTSGPTDARSIRQSRSVPTAARAFSSSPSRFSTPAPADQPGPSVTSPKIAPIVDSIATLTLLEVSELVTALKVGLGKAWVGEVGEIGWE